MRTHRPTAFFTCYEFYPVEWVFQQRISDDAIASIRERRAWIPLRNGKLLQRFLVEVILKLTSDIHNITCRAVGDGEVCRQTTVQFVWGDTNGLNTTTAHVNEGLQKGKFLQQYNNAYRRDNYNCSLHIIYNRKDERFECYSLNKDHQISLTESDEYSTELCYDSFSCGLLYNRNVIKNCMEKFERDTYYLRKTLQHSFVRERNRIGIVTCKLSGKSEKNGQVLSASANFFHSMPLKCNGSDNWIGENYLYVNLDPLSLSDDQHSRFIKFCGLGDHYTVYLGEILEVFCYTSVYLFAEGVQIMIRMQNGSEVNVTDVSLVHPENEWVTKTMDYRKYRASISIETMDISAVSCSAPRRRRTSWASEVSHVTVTYQSLQFEGNISEKVLVERGSDVSLKCYSFGHPRPSYEWKNMVTSSAFPAEWIHSVSILKPSELTIPSRNISMLVGNSVSCTAINNFENVTKTFTLYLKNPSSILLKTSDFVIVIVVIIFGGICALLVWKIILQRRKLSILSQNEVEEFMNGIPDFLINSTRSSICDINSNSACLPYNSNFEVLKEQLEIDMSTVLGSGAYGIVFKGILTTNSSAKLPVAIKTYKSMDEVSYLKALMSELKIMGFIGKHENIVNLLGAYTKNLQNREILIAIEYCDNGCLLNYLRSHREVFVDQLVNERLEHNLNETDFSSNPCTLTTALLTWSMQISNGMNFLCHKKVIHGDLAARNILLSSNLTAKIADFGLSRQLYEYSNYIKKQQSPLPWKWLAIECVQDMIFSTQSDVWAYGITLWEIFTLGHSPYPGCSYDEYFIDSLVEGNRPVQPQYATKECLMRTCWAVNPSERPSFADICIFFDNTIRRITRQEYMNIDSTSQACSNWPDEVKIMTHKIQSEEALEKLLIDITHN